MIQKKKYDYKRTLADVQKKGINSGPSSPYSSCRGKKAKTREQIHVE